jgi:hypothetical protein
MSNPVVPFESMWFEGAGAIGSGGFHNLVFEMFDTDDGLGRTEHVETSRLSGEFEGYCERKNRKCGEKNA